MRLHALYCLTCLCGHEIESEAPEVVCPHCARHIRIEWGRINVIRPNENEKRLWARQARGGLKYPESHQPMTPAQYRARKTQQQRQYRAYQGLLQRRAAAREA